MKQVTRRPPGYLTRAEAAVELGISEKTLERRMKTEKALARVLRVGRRIWLLKSDVDAHFELTKERGYI